MSLYPEKLYYCHTFVLVLTINIKTIQHVHVGFYYYLTILQELDIRCVEIMISFK